MLDTAEGAMDVEAGLVAGEAGDVGFWERSLLVFLEVVLWGEDFSWVTEVMGVNLYDYATK